MTPCCDQDDFYFPEDHPDHVEAEGFPGWVNWELPSAFDFKALRREICHVSQSDDDHHHLHDRDRDVEQVSIDLVKSAHDEDSLAEAVKAFRVPVVLVEGINVLADKETRKSGQFHSRIKKEKNLAIITVISNVNKVVCVYCDDLLLKPKMMMTA